MASITFGFQKSLNDININKELIIALGLWSVLGMWMKILQGRASRKVYWDSERRKKQAIAHGKTSNLLVFPAFSPSCLLQELFDHFCFKDHPTSFPTPKNPMVFRCFFQKKTRFSVFFFRFASSSRERGLRAVLAGGFDVTQPLHDVAQGVEQMGEVCGVFV